MSLVLLLSPGSTLGQQFYGDNQWVAPHGVATLIGTVGEDYAQGTFVSALVAEWEFNLQFTHYYEDPREQDGSYTALNLFAKHRLSENEAGTGGYAMFLGSGLAPEHLDNGVVTNALDSWWVSFIGTYAFADNRLLLDLMPGLTINLDHEQTGSTAWGLTYGARVAAYPGPPQWALVGEVFGTAGEAYARPSYRAGIRWESPRLVVAGTYSNAFDGSGGAGFELGFMYYTDPLFCFGGCRER